jgi:catechol 2,3-dioxygenase-like lactoylglutathione lyase family enzyme
MFYMTTAKIRGIDHIGITVPDIDAATKFLTEALGAEVIYDSYPKSDPPQEGADVERALNVPEGTQMIAVRMLKIEHGPGIELFEFHAPVQRESVRPSDYGLQHFGVYADDIDASVARFEKAGGVMFKGPDELMFPKEIGKGNQWCYGRAPWGAVIEFIHYGDMPYEKDTPLRRWKP